MARAEADRRERASLRALVEEARMLVPPPSTYSRAQLERELTKILKPVRQEVAELALERHPDAHRQR